LIAGITASRTQNILRATSQTVVIIECGVKIAALNTSCDIITAIFASTVT
jgi:hypothetical protein